MSAMVFVLPLPPNVANVASGRSHWRYKHEAQKKYRVACDMKVLARLAPKAPVKPFALATVSAHLATWNPMDDDNAMSRCKWALDWLVTRGYLLDDRKKNLTWAGIPTQEINRKSPSLTLTLTPLTPDRR